MLAAPPLTTARLDLEPVCVGHAREMATVLADPALHTYTGGAPEPPEALRARYERWTAGSPDPTVTWLNWMIRLRSEACLTGTVQATVTGGVAEVAWVVGTPWQGRGIATEAARALTAWLSAQGVRTIVAHIHPAHHASSAVARSLSLTPTDAVRDGETRWANGGMGAG